MSERITPQGAEKMLAGLNGQRWATMFKRGGLELEYYAPRGTDPQKPHTRVEIYFVISGSGTFVIDGKPQPFGPGEVLYLPPQVPHHFENFTDDFATWAIFAD
ncbi:MAG TPA: cupin domain-containing protein [Nevskiaceae bacterium]|nr:cupin domain-containing protein [Nevskiaceae bacterium]